MSNQYVRWWDDTNEQDLLHSLMTEAIKFYGLDVFYLPRTMRREDALYNEDVLSQFTDVYPIEVYLKNVGGWEGQGNFLNKFGLNIEHTFTIMISTDRFGELVPAARTARGRITADGANVIGLGTHFRHDLRVGDQITTEATSQTRTILGILGDEALVVNTAFTTAVTSEFFGITVPANTATPPSRPMEGDWVYVPAPIDKMFEVKFVENEKAQGQFYPLGTKTFYELSLETFTYSHEEVRTGEAAVDVFETQHAYSQDLLLSSGDGQYTVGETVYQGHALTGALASGVVAIWDANSSFLRVRDITGEFANGIVVIGATSSTSRLLGETPDVLLNPTDPLSSNRMLVDRDGDFVESAQQNPFGST